eukprot:scaffold381_cov178-Amphora_coffeaeformis.AAC.8
MNYGGAIESTCFDKSTAKVFVTRSTTIPPYHIYTIINSCDAILEVTAVECEPTSAGFHGSHITTHDVAVEVQTYHAENHPKKSDRNLKRDGTKTINQTICLLSMERRRAIEKDSQATHKHHF